jgi:hypothetical protein
MGNAESEHLLSGRLVTGGGLGFAAPLVPGAPRRRGPPPGLRPRTGPHGTAVTNSTSWQTRERPAVTSTSPTRPADQTAKGQAPVVEWPPRYPPLDYGQLPEPVK